MAEFTQAARLDTIRYSQVWEDHRLVDEGLALGPADDVLSIGSAGCNVLNALLAGVRSVTAVDVSPAQIALLELKLAAIRLLDHASFAQLLGASACDGPKRIALYARVRADLSPESQHIWDERTADIASSVLGCGRLERYFESFRAQLPSLASGDAVARLLDMDDLDAQAALFDREIATPAFEAAFRARFNRETMASEGRDPSQFRYVAALDVAGYFWERLRWVCTAMPTRGNFYLASFFTGRYPSLDIAPPYLAPEAFDRLRAAADRVTIFRGDVVAAVMSRPTGAFSKANLSDIFEYISEEGTASIFAALAERMRSGGRVCYWNLLVPRSSSPSVARHARLTPRHDIASPLWKKDRSWFYRAFYVDEIAP